jgi:hypothetical protein
LQNNCISTVLGAQFFFKSDGEVHARAEFQAPSFDKVGRFSLNPDALAAGYFYLNLAVLFVFRALSQPEPHPEASAKYYGQPL